MRATSHSGDHAGSVPQLIRAVLVGVDAGRDAGAAREVEALAAFLSVHNVLTEMKVLTDVDRLANPATLPTAANITQAVEWLSQPILGKKCINMFVYCGPGVEGDCLVPCDGPHRLLPTDSTIERLLQFQSPRTHLLCLLDRQTSRDFPPYLPRCCPRGDDALAKATILRGTFTHGITLTASFLSLLRQQHHAGRLRGGVTLASLPSLLQCELHDAFAYETTDPTADAATALFPSDPMGPVPPRSSSGGALPSHFDGRSGSEVPQPVKTGRASPVSRKRVGSTCSSIGGAEPAPPPCIAGPSRSWGSTPSESSSAVAAPVTARRNHSASPALDATRGAVGPWTTRRSPSPSPDLPPQPRRSTSTARGGAEKGKKVEGAGPVTRSTSRQGRQPKRTPSGNKHRPPSGGAKREEARKAPAPQGSSRRPPSRSPANPPARQPSQTSSPVGEGSRLMEESRQTESRLMEGSRQTESRLMESRQTESRLMEGSPVHPTEVVPEACSTHTDPPTDDLPSERGPSQETHEGLAEETEPDRHCTSPALAPHDDGLMTLDTKAGDIFDHSPPLLQSDPPVFSSPPVNHRRSSVPPEGPRPATTSTTPSPTPDPRRMSSVPYPSSPPRRPASYSTKVLDQAAFAHPETCVLRDVLSPVTLLGPMMAGMYHELIDWVDAQITDGPLQRPLPFLLQYQQKRKLEQRVFEEAILREIPHESDILFRDVIVARLTEALSPPPTSLPRVVISGDKDSGKSVALRVLVEDILLPRLSTGTTLVLPVLLDHLLPRPHQIADHADFFKQLFLLFTEHLVELLLVHRPVLRPWKAPIHAFWRHALDASPPTLSESLCRELPLLADTWYSEAATLRAQYTKGSYCHFVQHTASLPHTACAGPLELEAVVYLIDNISPLMDPHLADLLGFNVAQATLSAICSLSRVGFAVVVPEKDLGQLDDFPQSTQFVSMRGLVSSSDLPRGTPLRIKTGTSVYPVEVFGGCPGYLATYVKMIAAWRGSPCRDDGSDEDVEEEVEIFADEVAALLEQLAAAHGVSCVPLSTSSALSRRL